MRADVSPGGRVPALCRSTRGTAAVVTTTSTRGGQGGGNGVANQISAWVQAHDTSTTIGGTTVYDLTTATS
jgi:hypothetical protein